MPNWVNSQVTIKGPQESLNKFKIEAASDNSPIDLGKLIPMPKELDGISMPPKIVEESEYEEALQNYLSSDNKDSSFHSKPITARMVKELEEKHGAANWYDWSIKNYGTKWGLSDVSDISSEDDDELMYLFQTAWSPAEAAWLTLSERYPDLEFITIIEEEACQFGGAQVFRNGSKEEEIVEDFAPSYIVEEINMLVDMPQEDVIRDMADLQEEYGWNEEYMAVLKKKIAGEKVEPYVSEIEKIAENYE